MKKLIIITLLLSGCAIHSIFLFSNNNNEGNTLLLEKKDSIISENDKDIKDIIKDKAPKNLFGCAWWEAC